MQYYVSVSIRLRLYFLCVNPDRTYRNGLLRQNYYWDRMEMSLLSSYQPVATLSVLNECLCVFIHAPPHHHFSASFVFGFDLLLFLQFDEITQNLQAIEINTTEYQYLNG